jgi:hypothetical protein
MDELNLYLNQTNRTQFYTWLSAYCGKNMVESRFFYPRSILPNGDHIYIYIDRSGNASPITIKEDGSEVTTFDFTDLEPAVSVLWLEVGNRLKVTIGNDLGREAIPPIFDFMAELGKDWPETYEDSWTHIQALAEKYQIKLNASPFRKIEDSTHAEGVGVKNIKQRGRYRLTQDEINRRKEIVKKAEKLFKTTTPKITWKQIAVDLDVPERTLRDWRHGAL